MTTVKMAKGKFVTHVYNDPKTIADAKKKGFSLINAKSAGVESSMQESDKDLPLDDKEDNGKETGVTTSEESGNEATEELQNQTDSNSEGNQ